MSPSASRPVEVQVSAANMRSDAAAASLTVALRILDLPVFECGRKLLPDNDDFWGSVAVVTVACPPFASRL